MSTVQNSPNAGGNQTISEPSVLEDTYSIKLTVGLEGGVKSLYRALYYYRGSIIEQANDYQASKDWGDYLDRVDELYEVDELMRQVAEDCMDVLSGFVKGQRTKSVRAQSAIRREEGIRKAIKLFGE